MAWDDNKNSGSPFITADEYNALVAALKQLQQDVIGTNKAIGNGQAQGTFGDFTGGLYTDDGNFVFDDSTNNLIVFNHNENGWRKTVTISSIVTGANSIGGIAKIGNYIYALLRDNAPIVNKVVRLDSDLGNPTIMTESFIGTTIATKMASDGTDLYFTDRAGRGAYTLGDNTTVWNVTAFDTNTAQFTWSGAGTNPQIPTILTVGDSLNIPTSFHPNNQGTFTVTAVGSNYFRVTNAPAVVTTDPDLNNSGAWTYNATYWDYVGSGLPTDYAFRRNANGAGTGYTVTQATVMTVGKNYEFSGNVTSVSGVGGTDGFYMSGISTTRVTSTGTFTRTGDATSTTGGFGANVAANWITSFQITYTGRYPETNISGGTITFASGGGGGDYTITRASISGTSLAEIEDIECDTGGAVGRFDRFIVNSQYIYSYDTTSPYTYLKFNKTTGALVATSTGFLNNGLINAEDVPLFVESTSDAYLRIPI